MSHSTELCYRGILLIYELSQVDADKRKYLQSCLARGPVKLTEHILLTSHVQCIENHVLVAVQMLIYGLLELVFRSYWTA